MDGKDGLDLEFTVSGRKISGSYHITEIKSTRIESVDCGGGQNRWTEVVFQLLEPGRDDPSRRMTVGRARKIYDAASRIQTFDRDAEVVFEYEPEGAPTALLRVRSIEAGRERAVVSLESIEPVQAGQSVDHRDGDRQRLLRAVRRSGSRRVQRVLSVGNRGLRVDCKGMTAPGEMVSADLVNRLRAMVTRRLADRAEIDDVVQEVLIKIVRDGDAVSPERFWGWLEPVIYTTINDVYRARSARRSSPTVPQSWKRSRARRSPRRAGPTSTRSRVAF